MLIQKCSAFLLLATLLPVASAQFTQQSASDSKVVAVVDGQEITIGEIRQLIIFQPPQFAQQLQVEPKAALADYFIARYLGQLGEERQLDQRSPVKEQLEALRLTVLAGALINDERDGYRVSEEMQQQYYDAHQQDFVEAEVSAIFLRYKASVATTGTSADALQQAAQAVLSGAQTQRSEQETLELARDIVTQLRDGADFAELAGQYSDDAMSRTNGGSFGAVSQSSTQYPSPFRQAVLALEPGQVSDPIRLPTGFYIAKVTGKTARALRDVRESIIQTIRQEHLVQFLDELRDRFQVEVRDQSFFAQPGQALQGQ